MKNHKKIFYGISDKTLTGPKPLCIRSNKIDGFIRVYDGTRYVSLWKIWLYLQ